MVASPGPNQPSNATPSYPAPGGAGYVQTKLGITGQTLLKATVGAVVRAVVIVAGSTVGGIYDCTATAAAATANQIAVLPNTVGTIDIEFPCLTGIAVIPGSGQTVSVSYE